MEEEDQRKKTKIQNVMTKSCCGKLKGEKSHIESSPLSKKSTMHPNFCKSLEKYEPAYGLFPFAFFHVLLLSEFACSWRFNVG